MIKKSAEHANNLMRQVAEGKPITVKRGGKKVNTADTASKTIDLSDVVGALTYLYAVLHFDNSNLPQAAVENPNPTQPDGAFGIPADLFLKKEGEILKLLNYTNFVRYCKALIFEKGVSYIYVIVSLDSRDIYRLYADIIRDEASQIKVNFSVTGGNKMENAKRMEEIFARLQQKQEDYLKSM